MKQGRIEVTELTNYKRIKKLIKKAKFIGYTNEGFRKLITRGRRNLAISAKNSSYKINYKNAWIYLKEISVLKIDEILIFENKVEAFDWLYNTTTINIKLELATDTELDRIGELIGITRKRVDGIDSFIETDNEYRDRILSKIANNQILNAQEPITTIAIEPWQPFNNG